MYRVQHYEGIRTPKILAHLNQNENWITLKNNVLKNINCFVLSVLDICTLVLNRVSTSAF